MIKYKYQNIKIKLIKKYKCKGVIETMKSLICHTKKKSKYIVKLIKKYRSV